MQTTDRNETGRGETTRGQQGQETNEETEQEVISWAQIVCHLMIDRTGKETNQLRKQNEKQQEQVKHGLT